MATDGFVRLPNWLIDDSDLTLHELAVYIVLLRFRDPKTGKCWPGMTTIADRARVSRETVKRVVPRLEARGMVKVTRERIDGRNLPNVYEVAVATETPGFIWGRSARGRRIPRRRHSETPPSPKQAGGRHSETPPRHSETPGVGTPSASKKTQVKKIHEQAIRPTFEESGRYEDFSFDTVQPISQKQLDYLNDLHVHLTHRPVDNASRERWKKLSHPEIEQLIARYWEQIPRGRGGNWEGVSDDDPAWQHLTQAGRDWYYNGALPEGAMPWAS